MADDSFIINVDKIKPKETSLDENKFILDVAKSSKKRPAKKKAAHVSSKKKEKTRSKPTHAHEKKEIEIPLKEIKEIEKDLKKQIAIRKIVKPTSPMQEITKTAELLGHGLHYFVQMEEKIARDFFFSWLPEKIKKYLKLFIPFVVMGLFLSLDIGMSLEIKRAIGLFICIALLWSMESIDMVVTALLIPVLAVILGLIKNSNPFSSFSNPIIYLLLAGLILAQAFRKHELDKLLALKVLAMSKGKVKRMLLYLMIITALLGMWMSNTATIALLIPVILMISLEIKDSVETNYTTMFLLAAGFSSSIGGIATIIGANPNAITAAFLRNVSDFGFLDWSSIGIIVSIVLFITVYFLFVNMYKLTDKTIDISFLKKESSKIKLNRQQKKILLIFFPTVFLWLFGGNLTDFLHFPIDFYKTEVIGLAAAILLFAFRILEWDDVRRIPWEIFLLVGGGLTLGQILIDTGSASYLASRLFTLMSPLPDIFVFLAIIFLAIVLANFVNNSSTAIILVPILLNLAPLLGMDYRILAISAAMATAIAPLTPIAMPAFSLIYGTGKVKRTEMIKTGFAVASIAGPVLALLMYLLNWIWF